MKKLAPLIILFLFFCNGEEEEIIGRKAYILNGNAKSITVFSYNGDTLLSRDLISTTADVPVDMVIHKDKGYVLLSGGLVGTPGINIIDLKRDSLLDSLHFTPGKASPQKGIIVEGKLYFSDFTASVVNILNPTTKKIENSIKVGKSPQGIVEAAGKIFVCCTGFNPKDFTYGKGYLYVIEGTTLKDSILVGTNPQNAVYCEKEGIVWVICTGNYVDIKGKLYKISVSDLSVMDSIPTNHSPSSIYLHKGKLYVLGFGDEVLVYDLKSNKFADPIKIEGTYLRGFAADQNNIYLTSAPWNKENYLYLLDPKTYDIEKVYDLGLNKDAGFIVLYPGHEEGAFLDDNSQVSP